MADPRLEAVPHGSKLTPLMYAKSKAKGKQVNACPFGCVDRQLDQHGYCRHLVGFTLPDSEQYYYPMFLTVGAKRIVKPRTVIDEELSCDGEEPILKSVAEPVQAGDQLVKITSCSRVYRNVKDAQKLAAPPKLDKKARQTA